MKKDCTTCEWNFPTIEGAVCAHQYYGDSIEKCMKRNKFPCEGWFISFTEWCSVMDK